MKYFTNQHPYNTLDAYLKSKFNSKVFKISLNGDLRVQIEMEQKVVVVVSFVVNRVVAILLVILKRT